VGCQRGFEHVVSPRQGCDSPAGVLVPLAQVLWPEAACDAAGLGTATCERRSPDSRGAPAIPGLDIGCPYVPTCALASVPHDSERYLPCPQPLVWHSLPLCRALWAPLT